MRGGPGGRRLRWLGVARYVGISGANGQGRRVSEHCVRWECIRDMATAGAVCFVHACGLVCDIPDSFAAQGIAIVPTLVNIEPFTSIAAGAEHSAGDGRSLTDVPVRSAAPEHSHR